ncbi:MAG TPA: hypothetical protein PKC76_12510 [Saprospiraceae bacterium]|nr:hypothetical protein [Saprospiraceae bacterium]HMP24951.1 hypothetical protein [Saprospiraceae bacterium]
MANDKSWRLIGIFLLAAVLLNFPILGIFRSEMQVLGVPLLFGYLFVVWLLLIVMTGWIVEKRNNR